MFQMGLVAIPIPFLLQYYSKGLTFVNTIQWSYLVGSNGLTFGFVCNVNRQSKVLPSVLCA